MSENTVTLTITLPGLDAHSAKQRLVRYLRRATAAYREDAKTHKDAAYCMACGDAAMFMALEIEKGL